MVGKMGNVAARQRRVWGSTVNVLGCPLNRKEAGALGYMKIKGNNEAMQCHISYRLDCPKLLRQVSKDCLKSCFRIVHVAIVI